MKRSIAWILGFTIATTSNAFDKNNLVKADFKITHCHYSSTNNPLDVALINKGFLVLQRGSSPTPLYTRLGNLVFDSSTFLRNEDGYILGFYATFLRNEDGYILGFYANPSQSNGPVINGTQRIQIPTEAIPAQSTSSVQLSLNFNANEPVNTEQQWSLSVYDQLGTEHLLTLRFRKMDISRWYLDIMIDNDISGSHELVFDPTGELQPYSAFANIQWYSPRGMQALNFDFTSTTQFASPFSVKEMTTDGHASANLMLVEINEDGDVMLLYSNGTFVKWATLAVATFNNPKKLRNVIGEIYEQTPLSGFGDIQPVNSYGAFLSGYLELKNCVVKKKR